MPHFRQQCLQTFWSREYRPVTSKRNAKQTIMAAINMGSSGPITGLAVWSVETGLKEKSLAMAELENIYGCPRYQKLKKIRKTGAHFM